MTGDLKPKQSDRALFVSKEDDVRKAGMGILSAGLAMCGYAAEAAPVYLNIDNISVAVSDATSPGTFNNTFLNGGTIDKVIDAPAADALEFHNQLTHIWFTAEEVGGGLGLDFDFGREYDISTLHFWNYTGEAFDVDNVAFTFFDGAGAQVGTLSIEPALGSSPGIEAQDIPLDAPLNVSSVSAFLTGSNRAVDFQNIGFTAEESEPGPVDPSPVPLPAGFVLLFGGCTALAALRRKK